ncbi:MAG: NADH:flavin oxidoreductase [Planctomycetaceae bacterium]|nr:NADH:flavin oxidoreductase [Planctomycetaceae bacterium]
MSYRRVASFRTAEEFRHYAESVGADLPLDDDLLAPGETPLATPLAVGDHVVGNRFCILPMEGWDGTTDGKPTQYTVRRWENFGRSGAKLIWGGEAVAVEHAGRANPNQLLINDSTLGDLARLRERLVEVHQAQCGNTADLLVGLQLTHSGRFARPNDKKRLEPVVMYRHPVLDAKFGVTDDVHVLTDDELDALIERFVAAAKLARDAGYGFVDVKHCHGYLGHEMLSAFDRPGRYGGSLENRTRFMRTVIERIHAEIPGMMAGVRLSAFDWSPFEPGSDGAGQPSVPAGADYKCAFGGDGTALGIDLSEPSQVLSMLSDLGVSLVCISVGSPYYNPHIQRPALFPPSDGYQPPEDPLVGVARQIAVTAELKKQHENMLVVGSGYTYLQDWLPNVAQAAVRQGLVDSVGLGRMVLSYPELPADVLAGRPLARKKVCRTFSDCTTAPRNGLISGCYPLDRYYGDLPEHAQLKQLKKAAAGGKQG